MAVRLSLVVWFAAGSILVGVTQACFLIARGCDATAMLQVGETSPARPLLERELGPIFLVPTLGHDGKYFYLIARRPWFPKANAELLDALQDPAYRYGRPLYPYLAGLGGCLGPQSTLVGLIVLQILSGGLLAVALVRLARHNHLPTLAVLLGLANPGIYSSSVLLTSDLLALAIMLFGVLYFQLGNLRVSAFLFAAALLTKEYYALTPLALGAWTIARGERTKGLGVALLPLIPIVMWKVAVYSALGLGEGGGNFTLPAKGIADAAMYWDSDLPFALLGMALILFAIVTIIRGRSPMLQWQCAVWGLLGISTSRVVWAEPTDLLRVLSPLCWFVVWSFCQPVEPKR